MQQVLHVVPGETTKWAENTADPTPPTLHSRTDHIYTDDTNAPSKATSTHNDETDDQMNASSKSKGKSKEKMVASRTPPRNVTPTGALAEFPVQNLSSSRPATPLRSAMASTSRAKPLAQAVPLATSTSTSSLKRKVDDVDDEDEDIPSEPPKQQRRSAQRATFAAEPRRYRTSTSSQTMSYNTHRKRARISSGGSFATSQPVLEHGARVPSRTGSQRRYAPYNSSLGSRKSHTPTQSSSKMDSGSSHRPPSARYFGHPQRPRHPSSTRDPSQRGSISQSSIPISALVSPHAPSISLRPSARYHMRDPRKPPPVHPTSWSLSFPSPGPDERSWAAGCFDTITCFSFRSSLMRKFRRRNKESESDPEKQMQGREEANGGKLPVVNWVEGGGSPIHAWLFFLGFILFPLWWIAGLFISVPKTRTLSGGAGLEEKGVVLDDPQVEHDAKSWRTRCRVMTAISLFTYIPFIVLVVIFVPRS
ncbi:hypothetical protein F5878DRAFT_286649 [Lentinula raphanica]|uniref:Uncharacterized protein n=1 Tax=Lentinula raphanica TaxID=153919 RepID=A0AA38P430_9AGAR|nr:hypothetical protein F5878DRAFT_286649 [Lentinula raphanica]